MSQTTQAAGPPTAQASRLALAELLSPGITLTQLEQEIAAVQAEVRPPDRIRTESEIADSGARVELILNHLQQRERAGVPVEEAGRLEDVRNRAVAARQELAAESTAKQTPTPLNAIARRLEATERHLSAARLRGRAGLGADTQMSLSRAQIQLYWAHRELLRLGPEVTQGPESTQRQLANLTSRAEAAQRELEGGNTMSTVAPEAVGRG